MGRLSGWLQRARGALRRGRGRGFTLVELLVVMAIIAVLLTIAAPNYFTHVDRAKENTLRQDLAVMRDAIDKFRADRNALPGSLDELVEKRYLRKIPVDPITESKETWIIDPPPADSGVSDGVWDVRSGAEGQTHDGTPFGDL